MNFHEILIQNMPKNFFYKISFAVAMTTPICFAAEVKLAAISGKNALASTAIHLSRTPWRERLSASWESTKQLTKNCTTIFVRFLSGKSPPSAVQEWRPLWHNCASSTSMWRASALLRHSSAVTTSFSSGKSSKSWWSKRKTFCILTAKVKFFVNDCTSQKWP